MLGSLLAAAFRGLLALTGLALALAGGFALALGALGRVSIDFDAAAHVRLDALAVTGLGALLLALARRKGAAFVAAGATLAGLISLGAFWRSPSPIAAPSEPPGCRIETLTVGIANVEGVTPGQADTVAALLALDMDVLALAEATGRFRAAAGALQSRLPHEVQDPAKDHTTLWSRLPLSVVGPTGAGGRPLPLRVAATASVDVGGRPVGLASLHVGRPIVDIERSRSLANDQILSLPRRFRNLPPDRLIMGDLNAAPWSHSVRRIEAAAGATVAPGPRITWRGVYPVPTIAGQPGPPLPALIGAPIDHLLTSPGIGIARLETFDLPGSVHRGLLAEVQIPNAACGPLP